MKLFEIREIIFKVAFIILLPLNYLLYFIIGFYPRNKNIWVFGSWAGKRYADNSKWLFQYCNSHSVPGNHYVWISKKRSIVNELTHKGYKAAYLYSLSGILWSLKAGVYIFDSFSNDISFWTSRNALKVLLMHGVPIKKIGRDIDNKDNYLYKCYHGNLFYKILFKIIRPWWLEKYNLVPSTSSYTSEKFKTAFDLTDREVPVTGFARNDILLHGDESSIKHYQDLHLGTYNKRILYMPTFRDSNRVDREIPIDWCLLNDLLREYNSIFILKLHPNEKFEVNFCNLNNLEVIDKDVDVYHLLNDIDLLITDYSSVSLDFLITGKPIILYTYDLDEYCLNDRSLYVNYESLFQELNIIKSFNQLFILLRNYLNGTIIFGDMRSFCDKFHLYKDSKSSKRIQREIERLTIRV